MRGFFSLARTLTVLFAVLFLASCSKIKVPFIGKDYKIPKLEGLTPLASSGLSTTKDIRADVVEILMDADDVKILKKQIMKLEINSEANWTNANTGNTFTVRALEPVPEKDVAGSRKVVVWGRKKGGTKTMVKTYRYHF